MTGSARVLCVIGNPIAHSVSPAMHNAAIAELGMDMIYVPFHVEPENVGRAVEAMRILGIPGMNVTVPYKQAVIGHLDEVDEEARIIESVNTISNDGGKLRGTSTDGPGFIRSLEELEVRLDGLKAVVVGAGGAARATVLALAKRGAKVKVLNRTLERALNLAEIVNAALTRTHGNVEASSLVSAGGLEASYVEEAVRQADLLVNCTSVGMHPHADEMPVPAEALHPGLLVYDQIYNPERTLLLRAAEEVGARTANGLKMLVYQGAESFRIWTGVEPPVDVMEQAALRALRLFDRQV